MAALLSLAALGGCSSSSENTLDRIRRESRMRVGTDATYPPFESIDPATGRLSGFDIDLIRALSADLPAEVEFIVVPFDGIVPGLRSGHYDLIISAMTITPERAREIRFTAPYAVAGQSIVVRAGEARDGAAASAGEAPDGAAALTGEAMGDAAALAGKRIGCQLGTTGEMEARKIVNASVISFDAIGAAFRDMENGMLDAVIADTPTARLFVRDHPRLQLIGEPLTHEEFGMAVRLKDVELAAAMDRSLAALRASGGLRALEEKWGLVAPSGASVRSGNGSGDSGDSGGDGGSGSSGSSGSSSGDDSTGDDAGDSTRR